VVDAHPHIFLAAVGLGVVVISKVLRPSVSPASSSEHLKEDSCGRSRADAQSTRVGDSAAIDRFRR
jgi:hypothetical protein